MAAAKKKAAPKAQAKPASTPPWLQPGEPFETPMEVGGDAPPPPAAPKVTRGKRKAADAPPPAPPLPAAPPPAPPAPPAPVLAPDGEPLAAGVLERVTQWFDLRQKLKTIVEPLVEQERILREEVISLVWGQVVDEGTHRRELAGGWVLKCAQSHTRKFDVAAMRPVFEQLPLHYQQELIDWQPKLKTKEYKALSEDMRAFVDQCLVEKPNSAALELVPPAQES